MYVIFFNPDFDMTWLTTNVSYSNLCRKLMCSTKLALLWLGFPQGMLAQIGQTYTKSKPLKFHFHILSIASEHKISLRMSAWALKYFDFPREIINGIHLKLYPVLSQASITISWERRVLSLKWLDQSLTSKPKNTC